MEWLARHPGPWFALVWVPILLVGPLIDACVAGQLLRVLSVILLGAVNVVAVCLPFMIGRDRPRGPELAFACVLAVSAAYLVIWRVDGPFVYPLLAIAAAVAVRQGRALSVIAAVTISAAVQTGIERGSLDAGMFLGFATFMAGIGNYLVQYLIRIITELTSTRERLAHAAVAEERLRFSRDLHDLLGHTLSVIVVKAEAIRRIVSEHPDAAAQHATDVETIGRHALTEVREAVSGYRSVGLDEELAGARAALEADGIQVHITRAHRALDAHVDSLLGWIVREGTTNVLRHADASRCTIIVTSAHGVPKIEIVDDGKGGSPVEGSGLRGLRERVDEYGGVVTAVTTSTGFRLAASVPERARTRAR